MGLDVPCLLGALCEKPHVGRNSDWHRNPSPADAWTRKTEDAAELSCAAPACRHCPTRARLEMSGNVKTKHLDICNNNRGCWYRLVPEG